MIALPIERLIADIIQLASQKKSILFCGNSLAIRYMDTHCPTLSPESPLVPTFANRGVSGIDGQISTMIGLAYGSQKPVVGLIGDLTFYYDCNALGLLADCPYPVTVVILNNNGGRIFDALPHIQGVPEKDTFFTMPQTSTISHICAGFGCAYSTGLQASSHHQVIEIVSTP
ncbi:MAG: thiamine pyrophosphate-dependent enzyme [Candidatus Marinamargulisbacteria bacterium]|nr:thiamine pyrophosphate-dependent enzyme [Candidatus Marinamargulisbacteria bacterium]